MNGNLTRLMGENALAGKGGDEEGAIDTVESRNTTWLGARIRHV